MKFRLRQSSFDFVMGLWLTVLGVLILVDWPLRDWGVALSVIVGGLALAFEEA